MVEQLRAILGDEQAIAQVSNNAFDKYDTDHSGNIDRAELKHMFTEAIQEFGFSGPVSDSEYDEVLTRADVNRDGRVTKDEFVPIMRKVLREIINVLERRG